jgi:hypothetical protein
MEFGIKNLGCGVANPNFKRMKKKCLKMNDFNNIWD